MRYFDLIGQTLIVLSALFMTLISLGTGDVLSLMLIGQFCIGVWQMVSSLISILGQARYAKQKQVHFITAILYIIFLVLLGNFRQPTTPDFLFVGLLTIPAWTMAAWYYCITWRWAFEKRREGKFLPNVFL